MSKNVARVFVDFLLSAQDFEQAADFVINFPWIGKSLSHLRTQAYNGNQYRWQSAATAASASWFSRWPARSTKLQLVV
jgi:hypothetical protein